MTDPARDCDGSADLSKWNGPIEGRRKTARQIAACGTFDTMYLRFYLDDDTVDHSDEFGT